MKTLTVIAFGILTSLSAYANNPNIFIGKYLTLHGEKCDRDLDTRAYVSMTKDIRGVPSVLINYYSEEAVMLEIPTISGKVRSDGSPDHTDTIAVKWPNAYTMNVIVNTNGPRANYVSNYSLIRGKGKLTVLSSDGGRQERCELVEKK